MRASDVVLCLVAILFPPAAAAFVTGCSCDLLINILLTALGYIPGHIHAFWLIYKKMAAEEKYGPQGYIYIGNGTYEPSSGAPAHGHAAVHPSYGAVSQG
ncbi:upf0057-domain-containing partial [Phaffia rhodozyma]|uniref:Upf0057-domain-containing partial n=1 Tax=Phaffia rhodozyma TaxID=264483 RepID=A0A0F7SJA7_PHARH|nr:upf0057-domain-containing partial [Phaffia rhodozyma]